MSAPMSVDEQSLERAVRDYAELMGWLVYHTHDSQHSPAGMPDLLLVRPPRVVFAELKTENGRVRPAQQVWLDALQACDGVEAFVWRPSDWPAIEATLRRRRI